MPISGRPLLGRVLDRLRPVADELPIIVATSERPLDNPIAAFATQQGVTVFRGATNDVAGRILACAQAHDITRLVRISGDSPFIDPALCQKLAAAHIAGEKDLVTNVSPRSYPKGLSVEVISTAALARACEAMQNTSDREHVTPFMYRHPAMFSICNHPAPNDDSDVTLTVDTPHDHARACAITAQLDAERGTAALEKIIELARAWDRKNIEPERRDNHD